MRYLFTYCHDYDMGAQAFATLPEALAYIQEVFEEWESADFEDAEPGSSDWWEIIEAEWESGDWKGAELYEINPQTGACAPLWGAIIEPEQAAA